MTKPRVRILFVCLGNVCRSPLAEGVLRHLAQRKALPKHLQIDSAGTCDYHEGEEPDPRARDVAEAHGVRLKGRARAVAPEDFDDFDLIVAMDLENREELLAVCPRKHRRKVSMLRTFEDRRAPPDVPDPYYGGPGGFEKVYLIIERNCVSLLDEVAKGLPAAK